MRQAAAWAPLKIWDGRYQKQGNISEVQGVPSTNATWRHPVFRKPRRRRARQRRLRLVKQEDWTANAGPGISALQIAGFGKLLTGIGNFQKKHPVKSAI